MGKFYKNLQVPESELAQEYLLNYHLIVTL